ncbi:MAG: thiolase domain-containing protein [bacterium]|nr:thiolase domain-containing protein [bacterium]
MNSIIGYYSTQFGELWKKSLDNLLIESFNGALSQCNIEKEQIDAIFLGNMLGGLVDSSLLLEAHIAELLEVHIPVYRVEAACASGGMAVQMAHEYLLAHKDSTVVALGGEKMTDVSAEHITQALATAASPTEQAVGLTFPGVYALLAQIYLKKYHYTEEHLAAISVKNHSHGVLNEKAHFRRYVTVDDVLDSPYIAYPLKVLDSSPISDGAAAVVMTNQSSLTKSSKAATIRSSEVATDTISLAKRGKLDGLLATEIAGKKAFKTSGLKQKDINIMEVHDCFSIGEILALEDLGFWKKGQGGAQAQEMAGHVESKGNLIVNTSGGLKAAGHPVGGTGIKQIGEIYLQLTGQAGKRQVASVPTCGLAHNVGGSGGVAVVTILST